MTPEQLFNYADAFARRSESSGKGTVYPTFRMAAKSFKVTLNAIEEACQDWCGDGYMQAATGFRAGNGIGSFEAKGDWLVEAYK